MQSLLIVRKVFKSGVKLLKEKNVFKDDYYYSFKVGTKSLH